MVCVENAEQDILVVSEKGFGKRSSLDDYRVTNRGGKGVKTINITDKTGDLIGFIKTSPLLENIMQKYTYFNIININNLL